MKVGGPPAEMNLLLHRSKRPCHNYQTNTYLAQELFLSLVYATQPLQHPRSDVAIKQLMGGSLSLDQVHEEGGQMWGRYL